MTHKEKSPALPKLILRPGREKSLERRHPWVFSGSIAQMEGEPASGATVEVLSYKKEFLARAAYSPSSQIRARVWTFEAEEQVDEAFFRRRLERALDLREELFGSQDPHRSACRLVYAESDGLPGLVVDSYGDALVVQLLSAGAEAWRETLTSLLAELTGITNIYERSDVDVRSLEGLPSRDGPLNGKPPKELILLENGLQFKVDLAEGHKTGFYLDQRLNRQGVRFLARERDVLDCFCYTGGFTVNALAGGAKSVVSVDSSAAALKLCAENIALNSLPVDRFSAVEGDAFTLLRRFRDEGRTFDLVILDPPKFAPTASQVERAARAYKDINLLAFKLLRSGGYLVTFSCSGGVDAALFQKIIAGAALDAGVEARILEHLEQSPDHPVALEFPEGAYLKGLVCKKE